MSATKQGWKVREWQDGAEFSRGTCSAYVYKPHEKWDGSSVPATVRWSATGQVSLEEAEGFALSVLEAVAYARASENTALAKATEGSK